MLRYWFPKTSLFMVIPLILTLIIAAACGGDDEVSPTATPTSAPDTADATPTPTAMAEAQPTPTQATTDDVNYGGVINMHDYAFPALEMHPYQNRNQVKNYSGIYNQLIEYDDTTWERFDIRGDLAVEWDAGEDGKTYTFRLDDSAMFHDGTPVTADDVVYSFDAIVDPPYEEVGSVWPVVTNLVNAYYLPGAPQAVDEHTVVIPLLFSSPDFIPTIALDPFKVLSREWGANGLEYTDKWENAMGSGPFLPGKLKKDVSIELSRNPNYFKDGRPYLDGMIHITIEDKGTAVAAYKTGQVLLANWPVNNLSNKEAKQVEADAPDLLVYFEPDFGFVNMLMNNLEKPFDDRRVRQALNLIIHRQPYVELFGGGHGTDTLGPALGSGNWFSRSPDEIEQLPGFRESEPGVKHPDDVAEARRLMTEAGLYPDGFDVVMTYRTVIEYPDVAQVLVQQLKTFLNINVKLDGVDSATGWDRFDVQDFELAVQGFANLVKQPDALITPHLLPGGQINTWTNWDTPQSFIDLFNKQARETDTTKRLAILREMEDFIVNEDPGGYVTIYWTARNYVVNKKVKNFTMTFSVWAQDKFENLWCDPDCS
jgi:peptide/nickel transport system substrate-binding protein